MPSNTGSRQGYYISLDMKVHPFCPHLLGKVGGDRVADKLRKECFKLSGAEVVLVRITLCLDKRNMSESLNLSSLII